MKNKIKLQLNTQILVNVTNEQFIACSITDEVKEMISILFHKRYVSNQIFNKIELSCTSVSKRFFF